MVDVFMRSHVAVLFSRASRGAELVCALRVAGYAAVHPTEAGARLAGVVVVDPEALRKDVSAACAEVARTFPGVPQIVIGPLDVPTVIDALRAGATDYLARGATEEETLQALDRASLDRVLRVYADLPHRDVLPGGEQLLGESAAMARLRAHVEHAAGSDAATVIVGEAGSGKDLVARLLHERGNRAHSPFVVAPCSAIPSTLVEAALFGHAAGAFRGSGAAYPGLLALARGGTLVLSGLEALPLEVQGRLLGALTEQSVRSLGSSEETPLDFRLVVTTPGDLEGWVSSGQVRMDLYYRLAVVELRIPPLRERELDALELAEHFLRLAASRAGKPIRGFTRSAVVELVTRRWPGNVLELKNSVKYAVAVARNSWIGELDLPRFEAEPVPVPSSSSGEPTWESIEATHIEAVLRLSGGNRSRAAEQLGIDRKTLQRKLERFGIDVPARARSGTRPRVDADAEATQGKSNRFSFR